jgi:hypothetical protein
MGLPWTVITFGTHVPSRIMTCGIFIYTCKSWLPAEKDTIFIVSLEIKNRPVIFLLFRESNIKPVLWVRWAVFRLVFSLSECHVFMWRWILCRGYNALCASYVHVPIAIKFVSYWIICSGQIYNLSIIANTIKQYLIHLLFHLAGLYLQ